MHDIDGNTDIPDRGWQAGTALPPVAEGEMDTFILAVQRAEDGVVYRFAADYLNRFPLWCEPPRFQAGRPRHVAWEGGTATGWFDHLPDEVNGAIVTPLLLNPGDRIVGWCGLPAFPSPGGME